MIVPLIANHSRKMGANHIYIGLLGSVYAAFQLSSGPLIVSPYLVHSDHIDQIKNRNKFFYVVK